MRKLSPIPYRSLFFKHVYRFLGNVTSSKSLSYPQAVAVSGGMDSMALLWVAKSLYENGKIGPVRALFVHHQTRAGQDDDLKMIQHFCRQEKIPLTVLHAENLKSKNGNFEERARKERRRLLLKALRPEERLWQGHHLDDSYEWNFMQRHRTSNPKATLGIPVRHGPILRPFLCVTRAQIKRLVKFEGIPFREDPTNKDLRFDRNYVRHQIIPHIRKRYPKYLRQYSHLANFSAMVLQINVTNRVDGSEIYLFDNGAIIKGQHFSQIQIQELIHGYSQTNRGEIVSQIVKMVKAIDNGKKGPFHFSGRTEAYASHHLLMIYNQGMKNHDASIADVLSQLSEDELNELPVFSPLELSRTWENLLKSSDAMLNMPGLVLVLESDSIRKTMNTSVFDALFPLTSEVCKQKGLRFTTAVKCLETWRNKYEKLPLKLRLLPLWTLSNLFPSQQ